LGYLFGFDRRENDAEKKPQALHSAKTRACFADRFLPRGLGQPAQSKSSFRPLLRLAQPSEVRRSLLKRGICRDRDPAAVTSAVVSSGDGMGF